MQKIFYFEACAGNILLSGLTANIECSVYVDRLQLHTNKHTHIERHRCPDSACSLLFYEQNLSCLLVHYSLCLVSPIKYVHNWNHSKNTTPCSLGMCVSMSKSSTNEQVGHREKAGRILAQHLINIVRVFQCGLYCKGI